MIRIGFQDIALPYIKDQGHYGKVKSRFHHDVAHLHPQTTVPTKYQDPTPYGFQEKNGQKFKGQDHHGKVKGQNKITS